MKEFTVIFKSGAKAVVKANSVKLPARQNDKIQFFTTGDKPDPEIYILLSEVVAVVPESTS